MDLAAMDPALWELLHAEEEADPDRPVEAIIRLRRPGIEIPAARMVARFGSVATCRIAAADVVVVREHPDVISLKAARPLGVERTWEVDAGGGSRPTTTLPTDLRRPAGAPKGADVVVGCVDWGLDFASATFRHPPARGAPPGVRIGGTRLLALWDQREQQAGGEPPAPYGYGAVHDRAAIDRALLESRPYDALGYHHADADRGNGTHAQHVVDIAAGNGRDGGPIGIAPAADLVFVHLAERGTGGLANLGDSVRLLEAFDFICRTAGGRPCVINVSVGRHGGPHDGTTLAEIAVDHLLSTTPGLFVVNSAGNYFRSRAHASGKLVPGEVRTLRFRIDPHDPTPNELEIWYDGTDELAVRLTPPGRQAGAWVPLGARADVTIDGRVAGRVHHRAADPNNRANHIDAFLFPPALGGVWTVTLQARRTRSGWFQAWLERDDFCPRCQARFVAADSDSATTTGTLANGHLELTVGAYDGHLPARPPAPFSSAGPTVDGRGKPDLVAPGVDVLAARSAPASMTTSPGLNVRKSGTSMAAPHVTGAVALCLQIGFQAGYLLPATLVRDLVLDSCDPPATTGSRLGRGYLNIPRLLEATRAVVAAAVDRPTESPMETSLLSSDPAIVYRELLYRPDGDLARAIHDRFDVIALPGRRPDQAPQSGDVLLEVELGRLGRGRSAVLDGAQSHLKPRSLLPGQLLLRPRATEPQHPDAEDTGRPDLHRLIEQGLSENQITNALFSARNPRQAGTTLASGSGLARVWQVIRDDEVRPGLRARVRVSAVDPVELAVFLSQYENDDRVPAELTTRFLTAPPLLSLGRSLRDGVLANWRRGGQPLTAQRLFQLSLELCGDAGTATLLCHNVTKAFVREGVAITWSGTRKEGEYTDGQKTYQARKIHRSGQLNYFHPKKKRDVVSIFYLLFSEREFGTADPGDWYHFFVTATMTALSAGGSLASTTTRGRRQSGAGGEEVVRGGRVGGAAYRTLLAQQLADLEKQLTDGRLAAVPGYRGWVLSNALSFLEGGHYGGDFASDQSDVARESRIHLRGAAFGLQAIGGRPGRTWLWHVPVSKSLSELDLATGYRVRDKTWQVWDTKGKPQIGPATKAAPVAQEAEQEDGLQRIQTIRLWINAFIPAYIPAVTQTVPLKGSPHSGKSMIPSTFFGDCFLTDQRTFSKNPTASARMHSEATVDLERGILKGVNHRCSETVEVDCEDGDEEGRKTQSTERMKFGPLRFEKTDTESRVYRFTYRGEGSNPLVRASRLIGDIDMHGEFIIRTNLERTVATVVFSGKVDSFPAFEGYAAVDGGSAKTIFTLEPRPGKTALTALPGGADREVNGVVRFP